MTSIAPMPAMATTLAHFDGAQQYDASRFELQEQQLQLQKQLQRLRPPPIAHMPPELLDAVLELLPTPALLPIAAVDRRFYDVVSDLVYRRIRRASKSLAKNRPNALLLECYHPSAKIASPHLACAYVATPGLDAASVLERLPSMYCTFRPLPPDDADAHVRNYRAIRSTMNYFRTSPPIRTPADLLACDVHLDQGELFAQLVTVTSFVRKSARRGVYASCKTIDHGVVRVWRHYLERHKAAAAESDSESDSPTENDPLWSMRMQTGLVCSVTETTTPEEQREPHLQALARRRRRQRRASLVLATDHEATDEDPASYRLALASLRVKTWDLLLAYEAMEADFQE